MSTQFLSRNKHLKRSYADSRRVKSVVVHLLQVHKLLNYCIRIIIQLINLIQIIEFVF